MKNLINSAICTLYKLDGFLGEDEYFKSNLHKPITKQKEFEPLCPLILYKSNCAHSRDFAHDF